MAVTEAPPDAHELHIVLIEDEDSDAELIVGELVAAGLPLKVVRPTNKAQVRDALMGPDDVDAIICAYRLPDLDALSVLRIVKASGIPVPVIVVSPELSDEQAAECVRLGASDYVRQDDLGRLPHALRRALHHSETEEAGLKVERKYRRLFETLPMAITIATVEGTLLDANPATVAMFGYPDLDSLLATSAFDLHVDPQDRHCLIKRLERDGFVLDFETRMHRPDGSEFWFSRVVHAVREDDDSVVLWETIGRDSTEDHEAMQRLRESEAYLTALIETGPDAVIRMDESGQVTGWNSAARDIFGWTRNEALGRCVCETIIPPELRGEHEHGLACFHRDGSSEVSGRPWATMQCVRKNGEVFPVELAVSPPIQLGQAKRFVAFARDISEREQAEADLSKSEGRLRSLLIGAPVAITSLDLDGRVTFASGSVFTEFGIDPANLVGLLVSEAFATRPDILELWEIAREKHLQRDVEFAGRTLHLRGGPYRMASDGRIAGVRVVGFDNTERSAAERDLSKRVAQQKFLLELSQAGLEGSETADFLAQAVELVARGTETEFGTILELHGAANQMVRTAAYGLTDEMRSESRAIDSAFMVNALQPETPVIAIDFTAPMSPPRAAWMIEVGVVATMAVGIAGPAGPLGVLSVHSSVPREFGPDDLQFMQLASTIISVAVERKRAEHQRRMLLGSLVTAQEAERKTIAEDIHDDAVQVMTAANMRLELFRMVLTDPVQVAAAQKLQETVSLAIGRLRHLLFELIPPDLDRHGLAAAFRSHMKQGDDSFRWDLTTELEHEPAPEVRILLFRIFQEALVNVRKHASANLLSISLQSLDGGVLMRVADDGVGFVNSATEPIAGHLGLASMRERAEIAGGWWRLTSELGTGTEVSTWVPTPGDPVTADGTAAAAEAMSVG